MLVTMVILFSYFQGGVDPELSVFETTDHEGRWRRWNLTNTMLGNGGLAWVFLGKEATTSSHLEVAVKYTYERGEDCLEETYREV